MALLVDGFAHPQQRFGHYNPEGRRVITKLSGGLTPTSTSVSLQDDSFLTGNRLEPILVGSEVILYDKAGPTVVRGARGTTALNQPSGATASVFGYSSKVRNGQVQAIFGNFSVALPYSRIPTGGGLTQYNFGAN